MEEYIEREKMIDGICLELESANAMNDMEDYEKWMCAFDYVRKFPVAADVRPVIFCEDCDCWNEWDHSGRESLGNFRCSCAHWSVEDGPVFFTAPTDFCSYAEPKEEP